MSSKHIFKTISFLTLINFLLTNIIYAAPEIDMLRAPMKFGEVVMKTSRIASNAGSTPEALLGEINFLMDILGLKEYDRTLGILNNSLDPVAFVDNLANESKRPTEDVLKAMEKIPAFRTKALKYRERKAVLEKKLDQGESASRYLRVDVNKSNSSIVDDSDSRNLKAGRVLSDFLIAQYMSASNTPFAYRDRMDEYVGRFLGMRPDKPEAFRKESINGQELSDLQEELDKISEFFRGSSGKGQKIQLSDIVNMISNGIGANEMYLHQLSKMLNELAKKLGIEFHWEVVDNPADLERAKNNCINPTTKNTMEYDGSRSGKTTEPADFMEMTCKREAGLYINKRIVWANGERFKTLSDQLLERDGQASVLNIDNTPGNIGGRHMDLKTGMVYGPLFAALTIMGSKIFPGDKEKALEWAREQLKVYVINLYNANMELTPKNEDFRKAVDNPASQIATEMVRKREVEGRVKLAMVFDPGLRHFATEFFQNTNEGIAKPGKGIERNNNMHSFWDASDDALDYMGVFTARPELYQPIFIVDLSSGHADKMLKEAQRLRSNGIPVKVVTLGLEKINPDDTKDKAKEKFEHNLKVQAQATALLQTVVTTFTHLTDQDANSNPAVKMTREITAAIQDILVERQKGLNRPLTETENRVTLDQILKKMKETKEKGREKADKDLDSKIREMQAGKDLPSAFQDFINNALKPLAVGLGLDEKAVTDFYIGSVSRAVFSADLAESGGIGSILVDVALEKTKFGKNLGQFTKDFSLTPLTNQVFVFRDDSKGVMISFACPSDLSSAQEKKYKIGTSSDLPSAIAAYYYDRFMEDNRINTVNTIGVGYMDADTGNKDIASIMSEVNAQLERFGINSLPMNFPRIAHTGIEAAQALSEIIALIALIPSQSFPEGDGQLGSVEIRKGLTVNGANKIYGLSNISRMAFGGSPTVIVEYRNKEQLAEIKAIIVKSLEILAGKFRAGAPIAGSAFRPAELKTEDQL